MKKVFYEVGSLDQKCYEKYGLSEDILMENAAIALKDEINSHENIKSILIVCGAGNNGADGITLSRMLKGDYEISLYLPFGAKSKMASLQLKRANLIGLNETDNFELEKKYDIIVDCLFGSGLNKELSNESINIITQLNSLNSIKISCDIPSGINSSGNPFPIAFKADKTITMGALKTSLLNDNAKDFVGKIKVADLGVSHFVYEDDTDIYYLEKKDLNLPIRKNKNCNKGSFGHSIVVLGEKVGACLMTSLASFRFGSGLVSILGDKDIEIPYHIMKTSQIPNNCNAIAIGMGLGDSLSNEHILQIRDIKVPKVVDADMFYKDIILEFLDDKDVILTPHPKEFASLLEICGFSNYTVTKIQQNRVAISKEFSKKYPKVTLLLKGANTIIAQNGKVFINSLGDSKLSKGGSGDILAGLILSLLSQGYSALEASKNGSLALCIASQNFDGNSYALTPQDLLKQIAYL